MTNAELLYDIITTQTDVLIAFGVVILFNLALSVYLLFKIRSTHFIDLPQSEDQETP